MVSRFDGSQDSFIRVLLVDDEPGFLDLAKNFMEGDGSSLVVETASSADRDLFNDYFKSSGWMELKILCSPRRYAPSWLRSISSISGSSLTSS